MVTLLLVGTMFAAVLGAPNTGVPSSSARAESAGPSPRPESLLSRHSADRGSCTSILKGLCAKSFGPQACAVCAGTHQGQLRVAGCSNADIEHW